MPKSGQSRRRHMARSKRKAGGRKPVTAVQQAVASAQEAVARPQAPTAAASARTPKAVVSVVSAGDVTRELRRIGILTAIILIILVVISRVLA